MTEQDQKLIEHYDRWFRRVKREFCPLLLPFAGKPVTYVEIGCWAGGSAEWVCRNILTHPEARGYGIDPYPSEKRHPQSEVDMIKNMAAVRVKLTGVNWKWHYLPSIEVLGDSEGNLARLEKIDILYIDGDHDGHAVVQDFALAWPMLKVGSLVIFDDYVVKSPKSVPNVREGFDAIKLAWGPLIQEVGDYHRTQRAIKIIKKSHA